MTLRVMAGADMAGADMAGAERMVESLESKAGTYDIEYSKPLPPGVMLEKNVYAQMRDGVKIAMDVYKPAIGSGPWPVILAGAPYKKEMLWETANVGFYVPKGYVVINLQVRGSGLSQGQYKFFDEVENRDWYDAIEWIAGQSWCDGNVGMLGASYLAMSQWHAASHNPSHLKCIVPYAGGTDLYRNSAYPGGLYHPTFMNYWGPSRAKECTWPGPVEGKLPPANLLHEWYSHPEDGPFYWERSAYKIIPKIKVPVLCIVPGQQWLHSQSQLASWPDITASKKLMVIPEVPGMYQGFFDSNLGINLQIVRWLDHWLKGIDTGIMKEPPVAIYDNGTGEWRYENEYPLARTQWTKFYLRQNPAGPGTERARGLISGAPPVGREEPASYSVGAAPAAPPLFAVNWLAGYRIPQTQQVAADPATPPTFVIHTSEPLAQDLAVWGPLSITLYGSAETKRTSTWAWYVKIGEVAPDGKLRLWTFGNLKASYREVDKAKSKPGQPWHSFQNPVDLEPNKIYRFDIEIQPMFVTFKAGHKIWVQITSESTDFENDSAFDPVGWRGSIPANISVYHDAEHPSHLLLPVIPDAPEIAPVEPPLTDIYWGGPTI